MCGGQCRRYFRTLWNIHLVRQIDIVLGEPVRWTRCLMALTCKGPIAKPQSPGNETWKRWALVRWTIMLGIRAGMSCLPGDSSKASLKTCRRYRSMRLLRSTICGHDHPVQSTSCCEDINWRANTDHQPEHLHVTALDADLGWPLHFEHPCSGRLAPRSEAFETGAQDVREASVQQVSCVPTLPGKV